MHLKTHLYCALDFWLLVMLFNVGNAYVGEQVSDTMEDSHDLFKPSAASGKGIAAETINDERSSQRKTTDHDKFAVQSDQIMEHLPSALASPEDQQYPHVVGNLLKRNKQPGELKFEGKQQLHKPKNTREETNAVEENDTGKRKDNMKRRTCEENMKPDQRQRRDTTIQPSCRFPSVLETSTLCFVSQLIAGKVCKWFHTLQGRTPLFPFPSIVSPYRNWQLEVTPTQMRNIDNRYRFDCIKQYNQTQYLVKVTGKKKNGKHYEEYTSFLCLKFIPRGLNVVQYLSSHSNLSENVNCGTEKMRYIEQVLIADKFRELPDCPSDLRGAFKIARVHDAVQNLTCNLRPLRTSLLESDCVKKEGMHLDFSAFRDCQGFNNDSNGARHIGNGLYLRCYSASWENNGWTYVMVKRDKATKAADFSNTNRFYCLRFKKDPKTAYIKLYLFFDAMCEFNLWQVKNSSAYFVFDLEPLTSSLIPAAKQTELEQPRCDLPKATLGRWVQKSNYSGEQTIIIGKQKVGLGQDGDFVCMLSDKGKGIEQLFPTSSCDRSVWMERRKVSHFNYSHIFISTNLPIGCRPRFVGFSILHTSSLHMTYRLSQSVVLPMAFIQDPMLFVNKSLPGIFCSDRDLFRLDPYPYWGRNFEKIAVRQHVLLMNQPSLDCRFQGPLPNMLTGRLDVNVIDGGRKFTKCPGRIDICTSPTKIRLQYDISCRKQETSYGCLGRVWDTKHVRRQHYYLLQDLDTHQVYCARSGRGFKIVRAASMQCYELYRGLAAFQQIFHEKIEILIQGFMDCPTRAPTTNVRSAVMDGDISNLNITTTRPQYTNKPKVVNTSADSKGGTLILLLTFAISICLELLLF